MAALRPLLRADPICIGRAGLSGSNPDAQAMKLLSSLFARTGRRFKRRSPEAEFF
jgi:hypothetical protein